MVQSTKDAAYWREQIASDVAKRQRHERWWEANIKRYAPSVEGEPEHFSHEIHTNRTFTVTERKKADSFYQRPDLTLAPSPMTEGPIIGPDGQPMRDQQGQPILQTVALAAHQQIVNEKLGEDGVDATDMMDEVMFDIICSQGVGFTKMGYELHAIEQPDPRDSTGQTMVPVPVAEKCYWEHFSGKQAVIPSKFRSTNWDKAPYLGMQFELPLTASNRKAYNLPATFEGSKSSGKQHYDHGDGGEAGNEMVFTGVELYYRSALYRDDIVHPDHLTQLILVDGVDEPVIERDCPYQTLLPNGKLSPDSLIGFPIHPFSVRKLTDSAYVPSDGTMIGPLESELDVYRTQQVQFRDAAVLKFMANGDVLPADALSKIIRAPMGGIVVVPAEAFHGEGAIKELPQGSLPRENFTGQQAIDEDIARTVGIDGSAAGVQSGSTQTATAEQRQQANSNALMDKDRGKLLKRYVKGSTKFATLVQRYLPVEQAAQIVGPQMAQIWDAWRKTASSTAAFTAMPDSALRVDQAVDRKAAQDLYSFLANDPYIQKGRAKLLEKLLRKHHIDPTGIVAAPDPAKPEPPKLSFSFKGEDLVAPQAVIVLGIAEQLGLTIKPEWVQLAQAAMQQSMAMAAQADADAAQAKAAGDTRHGGKLAQQESLSKHHADLTGGMQNTGQPAAMGAAGGMLS